MPAGDETVAKDARERGAAARRDQDPLALLSYLITGIAVYGGIGWLLDRWLGLEPLFLALGVVFGVAAGGYLGYKRFVQ